MVNFPVPLCRMSFELWDFGMEINVGKIPFDLNFHPSRSLVASGLITGYLHLSAVHRLINLTENMIASGDDAGCIKFDSNNVGLFILSYLEYCNCITLVAVVITHFFLALMIFLLKFGISCCNSFEEHTDYISDMTFAADSLTLFGTSGDGTLSVCSLQKNKVLVRSEFSEDEPLSVVIMKADTHKKAKFCSLELEHVASFLIEWPKSYLRNTKRCSFAVFLGALPGLQILNFTSHWLQSNSVDALLKLDEERVITGSENGIIR
ncbi:hypothetical protein Sjap_008931 [Stephania japonica]|uniref:Uncharacterized protein n=1 Tax=Stephania japonica TaxID=461633 RepID=A0AAP0PBU5_9MAGN